MGDVDHSIWCVPDPQNTSLRARNGTLRTPACDSRAIYPLGEVNKVTWPDPETPKSAQREQATVRVTVLPRKKKPTRRTGRQRIDIKERCCACCSMMLTAALGMLITAACTASDMGVNLLDPTTYDRAWTDRPRVNKNPSHEEGGSVFVDPLYSRSSYSLYHQENQTRCQCYCKSPIQTNETEEGSEQESVTVEATGPSSMNTDSAQEHDQEADMTTMATTGSVFTTITVTEDTVGDDATVSPQCIYIERDTCLKYLPYNLSDKADVGGGHVYFVVEDAPELDSISDDPHDEAEWFLVLCSFLFPECREYPDPEWRHRCACPEVVSNIVSNCASCGSLEEENVLTCTGTENNNVCLRPATTT